MSVNNKYLLNLKTNDGLVWVRAQHIHESQPIVRLITRGNEEVLAPASSLLASSPLLRKVLASRDFLPVPYHTPVVILPDVTMNVANHVVDILTTSNTSGSDPEVIKEVKDTLEMLQISGNFEFIENVNSSCGSSMSNDVEPSNRVAAGINDEEISVKIEEEVEYVIKIEFDDANVTHNENEDSADTSDTSVNKENNHKQVPHKAKSNVEQVHNARIRNDSDDQAQLDTEVELGTTKLLKNESNKKRGSRKLSRKNASRDPKGQINKKDQTSPVAAVSDNDKLKTIKKQLEVTANVNKTVVKTLQCNLCDASFNSISQFKRHMKEHVSFYSCDQCDHIARHPSKLIMHKQAKHTDKIYKCDNCQFTSRYIKNLRRHTRAEHEGRTFNCNQCSFKSKGAGQLVIHRQVKHENTFYHCNKCSFKSKAQYYLTNHRCNKGKKK